MATAQQEIYNLILKDESDKDIRQQLITVERLWYYFKGINQISGGGGGGVASVTGNIVDNTDPANPIVTQVQSDWTEADNSLPSFILNKPAIGTGTFDQYIDGAGALRTLLVTDTLANIQTLATNSLLVPGAFYRINDAATNWEVVLPAASFTELGTVGLGIYISGDLYADIQYDFVSGILLKVSESKYNNTVEFNATENWSNISVFAWNSPNVIGNTIDGTSKFYPSNSSITTFKYNTIINNSRLYIDNCNLNDCNNNTIDNSYVYLTSIGLATPADFKQNKVINSIAVNINTVDFTNINNNYIEYCNLTVDTLTVASNFIDNKFVGYLDLSSPAQIMVTFVDCIMDVINNKFINTSALFNGGPIPLNTVLCTFKNNIFENNTEKLYPDATINFNNCYIDNFKNNKFYNSIFVLFDSGTVISNFNNNILENSLLYYVDTIDNLNNNSWKNCSDFEFVSGNASIDCSHNTFLETNAWVQFYSGGIGFIYNNMQYVRDVVNPGSGFSLQIYESQSYKYCISGVGSTFTSTLDFANPDIWNGTNQINFNAYGFQNWVGVYGILNASGGEVVTTLYKGPTDFPFYIWGQASTTISLLNTGNVIMNNTVGGAAYWYSDYDYMKFNSFNDRVSGYLFMTETFNY